VFRSSSGAEILVGKGADKNDELTFRVARGGDLFVHARDAPGSHVVVPLAGRAVDEATLLDAATLAVWFSAARPDADPSSLPPASSPASAQADVAWTYCKNVRKPRHAPAGRVSLSGGRTLRVRLDPERLRRLLASRVDSQDG
jgi:predicted ribosome quality control (RQC) complex YloA/Tae2 family protein